MECPPYTVLVLPSCNEPGLEVVNSLRCNAKFRVIGASSIDANCDPSLELVHEHVRLPWVFDPDFDARLMQVLDDFRVDLVFPTMDVFVQFLAHRTHPRARFVTPPPRTADVAISKKSTYAMLRSDVRVPILFEDWPIPLPAFAKPDIGSGGRGTMLVESELEFRLAVHRGLLVMEYLPGEEVTVDCLSDLDGKLLFHNPRVRAKVERSIAVATWSCEDTAITTAVQAIARLLPMRGPWFAQFKLDSAGRPCLLEVNARVAGSMTLSRLQGVNIPLISAFMFLGYPVEVPRPNKAIRLKRRLCNVASIGQFSAAIWDLDDTLLSANGNICPLGLAALAHLQNRGVRQFMLTKNPHAKTVLLNKFVHHYFEEIRVAEDKLADFSNLLEMYSLRVTDCVMVNDSNTEKLQFQRVFPQLRWVTPDALETLIS